MAMTTETNQLAGAMEHLKSLMLAGNDGEADPAWESEFDTWFADRYPEAMWSSDSLAYAWMKHAAYSAILWTSGMLPDDDKVFQGV